MRHRHRKAIRNAIAILEGEAKSTLVSDGKIHDLDARRDYRRYKRAAKRLRELQQTMADAAEDMTAAANAVVKQRPPEFLLPDEVGLVLARALGISVEGLVAIDLHIRSGEFPTVRVETYLKPNATGPDDRWALDVSNYQMVLTEKARCAEKP